MAKKEVKKSIGAIHINGKLTLLERKLSNVMLFNAYDNLLIEKKHEIPISLLAEISGYDSKDVGKNSKIRNAIRNLVNTSVEWDVLHSDGGEDWTISSLVAVVNFSKRGICTYEYTDTLAEKLKEPEIYGLINLEIQKLFTSGHTLVIYELCSRYKGLLKKRDIVYTEWINLEDFKKLLGIEKSEYYNQFKELNRKIIKPSVDEISGNLKKYSGTDIIIKPEYKRVSGRAITDIRFVIKGNPQLSIETAIDEFEEIRKTGIYVRLCESGFTDKGAINAIKSNTEEYLKEKLDIVEKADKKGLIKSSKAGYLTQAIKEDFKNPEIETEKKREEKKQEDARIQKERSEEGEKTKRKNQIAIKVREEYINSLSKAKQKALLKQFQDESEGSIPIKDLSSFMIFAKLNKLIPDFEKKLEARAKEVI